MRGVDDTINENDEPVRWKNIFISYFRYRGAVYSALEAPPFDVDVYRFNK